MGIFCFKGHLDPDRHHHLRLHLHLHCHHHRHSQNRPRRVVIPHSNVSLNIIYKKTKF